MQDGSLLLPAQVGSKNLAPLYDKVKKIFTTVNRYASEQNNILE
jgi:hypothetical protein